jgi:hypothetical protein
MLAGTHFLVQKYRPQTPGNIVHTQGHVSPARQLERDYRAWIERIGVVLKQLVAVRNIGFFVAQVRVQIHVDRKDPDQGIDTPVCRSATILELHAYRCRTHPIPVILQPDGSGRIRADILNCERWYEQVGLLPLL